MSALAALLFAAAAALPDPRQEARAQRLEAEIRCVVCENEPISESVSDRAEDMRREVRARIAAGDTDAEVRDYFADRYGEYVLLRPRLQAQTLALWLAPALFFVIAAFAYLRLARAPAPAEPPDGEEFER